VFILTTGRVKLSICSGDGRTLILRLAEPGDIVGLPGTLAGNAYEVTAAAIGPCRCTFVKREPFLRFMNAHKEIWLGVTDQLRKIYCSACYEIRRIGLSHSAVEKLAELLVGWPATNGDSSSRIRFPFSHEEVGQMVGSSRETVSRAFATLKKKGLAELNGATLHIRDRAALEAIAAGDGSLTKLLREKPHLAPEGAVAEVDANDYFHPDGV
jgi:CRP/FNR family transcriptional regulator